MTQLLDLHRKQWHLMISPIPKRLLIAIAQVAHHAELRVLDCGRRFDSSIIARAARGRQEIIDSIKIQRAFTCYEAVKLLDQAGIEKKPLVILDFLATFYDENVKMSARNFLLETSLRHFTKLSHHAGIAISIYPPAVGGQAYSLFEKIQSVAPNVSNYGMTENINSQMSLF